MYIYICTYIIYNYICIVWGIVEELNNYISVVKIIACTTADKCSYMYLRPHLHSCRKGPSLSYSISGLTWVSAVRLRAGPILNPASCISCCISVWEGYLKNGSLIPLLRLQWKFESQPRWNYTQYSLLNSKLYTWRYKYVAWILVYSHKPCIVWYLSERSLSAHKMVKKACN